MKLTDKQIIKLMKLQHELKAAAKAIPDSAVAFPVHPFWDLVMDIQKVLDLCRGKVADVKDPDELTRLAEESLKHHKNKSLDSGSSPE